ncbi:MAG: long-chain fatty acid--CoA ligase, partial [Desulfobulbaceae bacterium]|nr:long-chain fatty acid--CoA ligase [Desulfobulbaceae bacterium]
LGYMDQHNNLVITGRSKNVIVLANGENIYPESIEDKINALSHVTESVLIANNDRLEALIYPDYDLIDLETTGKTHSQKRQHIDNLMKNIQKTINSQVPPFARLASVVERREPFTKTATHKIKRYLYQPTPTKNNHLSQ